MRVGTAHHLSVNHVGQVNVIHIIPLALDEPQVFLAFDGVAHATNFRSRLLHYFAPPSILAAANCTALTMFWYPVQRQRLPEMPQRISSSVGFLFFCSRTYDDISMPGVQKPHCRPCSSLKPSCKG